MSDEMHVGEVQGEACEEVLPGICDLFAGQVPEKEQEGFRLYALDPGSVLLVARADTGVVGVLAGSYPVSIDFAGLVARVDSLLVHRERRRRGIATLLLEHFRRLARDRGCAHLVTDVPFREGREAARLFWESRRFRESDLRQFSSTV
jgi:GNAT superfamily N-acetyltransferase